MNKKKIIAAGVIITICFMFSGCANKGVSDVSIETADPLINADNAQMWREVIQRYRADDRVKQLMLVRYTGGCDADVFYYIKNTSSNDAWELAFEKDGAYVGKYGIGKTKEGDAKTPVGEYKAVSAFGILPDPGTAFEWTDITPVTYSCDENCKYYNQIIDTKKTGHKCTGERMYDFSPEYNYGIALNYNEHNIYPEGSAIYLHCKGPKPFTGGCIAISQDNMELVLKTACPGFIVCIGEN